MERSELKRIISDYLHKGVGLSEIQDKLKAEHSEQITFLELRLLASELENVDWKKVSGETDKEPEKPKKKTVAKDIEEDADMEEEEEEEISSGPGDWEQGTVVEISKIARPGAALSGSVKFSSGAKADWVLDQFGRLMFENAKGKPTQKDLKEFQAELQRKLGAG